jgi:transposase
MPDVTSNAPAGVRMWVALDVHKLSIVAATLPASGGTPDVHQIETTRAAIRRFIDRLGGPSGLAVSYEAGPGGFDLLRVLSEMGVACDVIAPSLIPVRVGDRIKTDRRDAKKLVRLYRAGELSFVAPPTPETEGLRDLMRARDDLRCARTAARHRVTKQLLRHGRIYRDGTSQWTKMHRAWIARQRLDDNLAHAALCQMLMHLDGLDRQLDALDRDLEQIAIEQPWAPSVEILTRFKGISTRTALGLIAEIGDFHRFSHPRELAAWLGIVPERILLRGATPPRAYHHDRQPPRPPAADRSGLGLPTPAPRARTRTPRRRACLDRANPPAPALPASDRPRQALDRCHRCCCTGARGFSVGRDDRTAPGARARRLTNPELLGARRPPRPAGGPSNHLCDPDSRPECEAAHDRTLSCGSDPRILRVTVVVAAATVAWPPAHSPP